MGYTWVIYALLAAVFAALVAVFGKIGLRGVDANTATAIRAVVMALFLVAVILVQGKFNGVGKILENWSVMKFIFLSGVAGALSWLFYFLALQVGNASQVAPIDRLSVVFVLILGALFLGETVSLRVAIGGAFVVVGGILVALG